MSSKYTKMTKTVLVDEIVERDESIAALEEIIGDIACAPKQSCGVWKFFKYLIIIAVVFYTVMFTIGFIGGMNAGLGKTIGVCAPDLLTPSVECAYITLDSTPVEVEEVTEVVE